MSVEPSSFLYEYVKNINTHLSTMKKILQLAGHNNFYVPEIVIGLIHGIIESAICIIDKNNDNLIGFSLQYFNADHLQMQYLLIDKDHRNKGLAKIIINLNLRLCVDEKIKLLTETESSISLRFFIKNGFKFSYKNGKYLGLKHLST